MKKIISICLSVFMILSTLPFVAAADAWTGTGGENVEFSFGLISDVHDEYETLNLDQSVNAALDLGAQFIAFNGDITSIKTGDGTTLESYDKYYELVKPVYDDLKEKGIEYSANMGNHEFAGTGSASDNEFAKQAFENYVGPTQSHVVSEQGFHFISVSPESYKNDFSSASVDYMIAETEKAIAADSTNDVDGVFAEGVVPNSTKPVFVLAHWKNSTLNRFLEYAKTRPQIIFTYGHFHTAVEYPANIQQDGYTSYMSPVSYGNANMYGKMSISPHQSTHVEVETGEKGSVVKLYKLSLDKKEFIGEPWVIDIGAIVSDLTDEDTTNDLNNYLYSADKRANPSLPYFAEGATLQAQPVFTSAKLIFPKALIDETPNQQDDFIFAYIVEVYDENDTKVYTKTIYPEFVNNVTPASSYSQIVTGLEEGTTYTAKVIPVSALSNVQNGSTMPADLPKGEPLTVTFSTVEDTLGTETKTEETIKVDEKTVIEYEAWKSKVPKHTMTELYGTSGSRIIYNTGGKINGVAEPFTFSIPVNVEKAGTYKVEYVAAVGSDAGYYAGNVQFAMEKNGAIGDTYNSTGTSLGITAWEHHVLKKFTKTVTLKAGTDNLQTTINLGAGNQHLFELDYISFECVEVFEIKLDSAATIEFEDYPDYAILEDSKTTPASLATLEDADAYSNGKAYSVTDEAENFDVSLPLAVQKTGKFDIEYKASKGAVLYITDANGETVKTIDTSSYEGEDAIATITENNVILEAGDYTVSAKILATDGVATGILDSVKFTKTAYYNPVTYDKPVILEAEDFREIYRTDKSGTVSTYSLPDSTIKTATLAYSGDGYVQYNAYGYSNAYSAIEIDVKTGGKYTLEYYVRNWNWNSNNYVYITLDNATYAMNRTSDTWTDFGRYSISVTLTEGTHTVGYKAIVNQSGTNCYFAYDYIKVTPAYADISATEKTVIQGEDMHTVSGTSTKLYTIASDTACDGGRYLNYNVAQNVGTATTTATINVEETNYYDVTASLRWLANYTGYTVKIDSTTLGTIAAASSGDAAWKTVTKKVKLTEGTHTLTITSTGLYGHADSYIDYISFEPYDPTVTVPAEGVLIEAESNPYVTKYVETTTTITDEEGTTSSTVVETKDTISVSATTKISYNYSTANTDTVKYTKVTWDQPINVQKAGQYVISYTINQSAWYHGKLYPMLDGKQLAMTADVETATPALVKVSYVMDLTKGAHTLGVKATKHSNNNCTIVVDCVSVYPLENAFESADISEPKTTIEVENYTGNTFIANTGYPLTSYTSAGDALSGKSSLYMTRQSQSASSNLYVVFPINVTTAGTYDLEFSATGKDTSYSSGITLSIDGAAKVTTSHSDNTVFKTYTVPNVTLTEGIHMVKFEIQRYGVNARGKIDYISFSPAESAVYDDEALSTTVTANIETAGEVIIALYDADGKLAGIHTETADAPKTLRNIEVACGKIPVSCTVYVWEDLVNVKPLTEPKAITVE